MSRPFTTIIVEYPISTPNLFYEKVIRIESRTEHLPQIISRIKGKRKDGRV